MSFEGPVINRLNGGLGRTNPPGDASFGLVLSLPEDTPSPSDDYAFGDVVRLLSTEDAVALGMTASYDSLNKVLINYHISEIFRLAPDAEVFLMLDREKTLSQLIPQVFELVMSETANRRVKYVAVAEYKLNHTIQDNISEDVLTAIPLAQAVIDQLFENKIFLDGILLEGRSFGAAVNTAAELRELNCPQVSVCIGADPAITALDDAYLGHAAVGSALGMLAVRQVNENLGSVDIKNKPSQKRGNRDYPLGNGIRWNSAILSGGTKVSTLTVTQTKDLTSKGYIFAGSYEGYAGVFFNSSPTCVEKSSDYAYIENNRVFNKAARIIRSTLIPRMKSTLKKDASGKITSSSASGLEAIVNTALKKLLVDQDECSAAGCYINPDQTVSKENPLLIRASVQVDDIIHEMSVDLGLTTSI